MNNQEYEQKKKKECWEEFVTRPHENPQSLRRCFDYAFDRAYALGKQEKDAEGDEMLYIKRSKVQQLYKKAKDQMKNDWWRGCMVALQELFGSKCLPDEVVVAENATTTEPKPAEPKFEVGDKVIYKGVLRVINLVGAATLRYCLSAGNCYAEWVDESVLEPYTNPGSCQQANMKSSSQEKKNDTTAIH